MLHVSGRSQTPVRFTRERERQRERLGSYCQHVGIICSVSPWVKSGWWLCKSQKRGSPGSLLGRRSTAGAPGVPKSEGKGGRKHCGAKSAGWEACLCSLEEAGLTSTCPAGQGQLWFALGQRRQHQTVTSGDQLCEQQPYSWGWHRAPRHSWETRSKAT